MNHNYVIVVCPYIDLPAFAFFMIAVYEFGATLRFFKNRGVPAEADSFFSKGFCFLADSTVIRLESKSGVAGLGYRSFEFAV